jgi:hypothetical protein
MCPFQVLYLNTLWQTHLNLNNIFLYKFFDLRIWNLVLHMKSKGCGRPGYKNILYFTLMIMEKSLHFTVKVFLKLPAPGFSAIFRGAVSKYIYLSNTRFYQTEQNVTTNVEICLINAWQHSREVGPLKMNFPWSPPGAQLLVSRDLPPTSENLSSSNNCRNWAPTFWNSGVDSGAIRQTLFFSFHS